MIPGSGSFLMTGVAFFGGVHDGQCSQLPKAEAAANDAAAAVSRWQLFQSGSRPVNLTIAASAFMTEGVYENGEPMWHLEKQAELSLLGNLLANYSGNITQNDKTLADKTSAGTTERIVAALDNFRRLGQLDFFFNHPDLLGDHSLV